ncbi:FBP C-terminal treble-clef zinc-finger [Gracilibacillus orientalis]|uniref:FBP C-terminal treble-clef zinc-finger n=1 Tax=Gracilibacillus orientalis TaxID=334253 RepID=A0A1I4NCJ4_9BACI|nr:FusB/FusC family EF-G-binding protein [Gracilibacillus orientalis]SFM13244.1 FBP C-terminal treble-clef zinc-finger [Gracilibacillus orientalis]
MDNFIYPHQFHFIKLQTKTMVSARSNSTDADVIHAVKEMAIERINHLLPNLTTEQEDILMGIDQVKDKENMEQYLQQIKQHVIPFPTINDKQVQKTFPKVKKLQTPDLEQMDRKETVYLRWYDKGSAKTYMLILKDAKLIGIQGYLESSLHKGICTICNELGEVALFTSEKKGQMRGMYTKKGNYICKDPVICNQNITDVQPLHSFVEHLKA